MKNWKLPIIIVAVVLCVFGGIYCMMNLAVNKAVRLEHQVETAKADIRIKEKARNTKLTNLAETVKHQDEMYYNLIVDTIHHRTDGGSDIDVNEVSTVVSAVYEAYPQLNNQQSYDTFMNEIIIAENTVADYREYYNNEIKRYKNYVEASFPNSNFLDIMGYQPVEYKFIEFDEDTTEAPTNFFD